MRGFLCWWLVLLACTTVRAQATEAREESTSDSSARVIYNEGRTAFDEGRYEHALQLFENAYDLSPRPELLYNIGTTADRLRQNERALEAFEEYVIALPFAGNRSAVDVRITVLRQELTREQELQAALHEAQSQPEARRSKWWIGVLVGGLALAAAALAVGIVVGRDDTPQYRTGDDGRLVFTLERTR